MKAIRINKTEIIYGKRHVTLLFEYMEREGLSEDQADSMIEEGNIEFGGAFLNKDGTLEWSHDDSRTSVYKDVDSLIKIGGRP